MYLSLFLVLSDVDNMSKWRNDIDIDASELRYFYPSSEMEFWNDIDFQLFYYDDVAFIQVKNKRQSYNIRFKKEITKYVENESFNSLICSSYFYNFTFNLIFFRWINLSISKGFSLANNRFILDTFTKHKIETAFTNFTSTIFPSQTVFHRAPSLS